MHEKIGISTFVTDDGIDPVSLARAIEERGFDSLVIAEHTHIPGKSRVGGPTGGELPSIYYRTLAIVCYARRQTVAVTSKIELFTGIPPLIQRDPIMLAKEVATLDQISDGRFCSASARAGTKKSCATTARISITLRSGIQTSVSPR